jgi:putative transposase
VDECHRKVAAFLTDNYRLIFRPTFESAKMVAKAGGNFGSKTARALSPHPTSADDLLTA